MKTCNNPGMCKYKTYGNWFYCKYDGYCDYQAPKDSTNANYKTLAVLSETEINNLISEKED